MSNKKSGIKEGLLAIFLGNKNYINLEMMREAKKTVYTGYLNDDSNDLVFIYFSSKRGSLLFMTI